jgi:hypothetical protein
MRVADEAWSGVINLNPASFFRVTRSAGIQRKPIHAECGEQELIEISHACPSPIRDGLVKFEKICRAP